MENLVPYIWSTYKKVLSKPILMRSVQWWCLPSTGPATCRIKPSGALNAWNSTHVDACDRCIPLIGEDGLLEAQHRGKLPYAHRVLLFLEWNMHLSDRLSSIGNMQEDSRSTARRSSIAVKSTYRRASSSQPNVQVLLNVEVWCMLIKLAWLSIGFGLCVFFLLDMP